MLTTCCRYPYSREGHPIEVSYSAEFFLCSSTDGAPLCFSVHVSSHDLHWYRPHSHAGWFPAIFVAIIDVNMHLVSCSLCLRVAIILYSEQRLIFLIFASLLFIAVFLFLHNYMRGFKPLLYAKYLPCLPYTSIPIYPFYPCPSILTMS